MNDVVENGGATIHNGNTFNGSAEVQRKPSYLVSLSNDLYDLPNHAEVAPYEEPVVSLSQYETIEEGEVHGHSQTLLCTKARAHKNG